MDWSSFFIGLSIIPGVYVSCEVLLLLYAVGEYLWRRVGRILSRSPK